MGREALVHGLAVICRGPFELPNPHPAALWHGTPSPFATPLHLILAETWPADKRGVRTVHGDGQSSTTAG